MCTGEQKQFQISFAKELQKSFLLVNADELKYDIGTYVDTYQIDQNFKEVAHDCRNIELKSETMFL